MGSVNIATIATNISNYSVSGVTIRDLDKILESVTDRHCPILMPDPDNFVTNFGLTRESIGADTVAKKDVNFTLNYMFLYAPVGGTRNVAKAYDGMMDTIVLILNAFANDSDTAGAIDIIPVLGNIGVVQSPDGMDFFGCDIALNVLTFYEVN